VNVPILRSHRTPRPSPDLFSPARFTLLLLSILLALALPGQELRAQDTGSVQGQVVDSTGGPLPGVLVRVQGIDRSTLTDEDGRYLLRGLPTGSRTLQISYLGYESASFEVDVRAGEITVRDVTLQGQPVEVEGITVEAQRGILRTLERKRQSPTIVDVLDQRELQKLPFQDMVEGFDQLPAVNVQGVSARRGFQNSFIVVRGIQPSLNEVSVSGMPLASTVGDRAVALDVLPGRMASQLEVVKTVTPDMSANSIGGTANIVPMSAFQRRGSFLSLAIQGAAQDETGILTSDEVPLDIDVAGSARLSETFGIAVTGSFKQETFARTFSQPSFQRFSGTANLDWRPDPRSSFSLLTSYTETDDEQISTQTEWNYADGKDNIPFDLLSPTRIFSPEGENEKEMDIDEQTEQIFFTVADAQFRFDPVIWDISGSYMRAELDELVREWSFDSQSFESTIDVSGEVPWATPSDPTAFSNPANYTFDEIDVEPDNRVTDVLHAETHLRFDTDALGRGGFFKVGGSFRNSDTDADRDENQMEFDPASGFDDITLSGLGLDFAAGNVFGFPVGPAIDPFRGPDFIDRNPGFLFFNEGASIDDQIEGDYAVDEDIVAGYAMASGEWGPWRVVGGVRVEHTNTRSDFKIFNENDESISAESEDNDYTDVLPNLQVRYRVSDRLQLRGAFTQTIARANLSQLAGARNIDFDNSDIVEPGVVSDASVEQGNPLLDPFESTNLDATVEFYPRRGSFYMIGLFYKEIDNAIFTQSIEQQNVTLGGTLFQELDFERPLNAESGELFGLEAQVQETFTFLPAPFDGLGVTANVALLDSEFGVPGREDEDLPLFQQPDVVLAVTPFLNVGDFTANVSYQYTDEYVVGFGSRPDEDEFFDARETLDAQISYRWQDMYTLVLGAENLTTSEVREFQGASNRTVGLEEIPRTFWFGLRAQFDALGGF